MLEGSKKGAQVNKGRKGKWFKKKREKRLCEECNKPFFVIETSKKRFHLNCSAKINGEKGTEIYLKNINGVHQKIKEYSIQWVEENKEKIMQASFTKVRPTLEELLNEIEKEYEIKDIRIITKALIGEEKGRKDLLAYFKEVIINELIVLRDSENPRVKVKNFMEEWAMKNKKYLETCDFKKAREVLKPLAIEINREFGYKIDIKHRVLQRAIFGKDLGCNNVLLYLKNLSLSKKEFAIFVESGS